MTETNTSIFKEAERRARARVEEIRKALLKRYGFPLHREAASGEDQLMEFLRITPEEEQRIMEEEGPAGLMRWRLAMLKEMKRQGENPTTG